ncbi:MAG: hypothetical protein ABI743_10070 [bacterium]
MRGWPMVIAMILAVALVATLAVLGVGPRPPVRTPAPTVDTTTVIATSPTRGAVINASAGSGPQLVVVGNRVWVCWTVTATTGNQAYIADSSDGGVTFGSPIPITYGGATMLQPSIVVDPASGDLVGITAVLHGNREMLEGYWAPLTPGVTPTRTGEHGPGPWGTTALVWLTPVEGLKFFALQPAPMIAPPDTSYSDPYPVVAGTAHYLIYKQTENKTTDTLWCLAMNLPDAKPVRVDDDTTGAGKLGHSGVYANGQLQVAYVDARRYPNRGCLLYTTRSASPTTQFAPSQLLDPPVERAWQVPPTMHVAEDGTLFIGATQSTEHYYAGSYREKLSRFGIGGLHQVIAYSREPAVWQSQDQGASWQSLGPFDDQQIEVSSGGVQVATHGDALGIVWMESRPITEPPDVRWALRDTQGQMSATESITATPGDTGIEMLYGAAWLDDGRLLALYRDTVGNAGDNYQLVLARSTPIIDDAAP